MTQFHNGENCSKAMREGLQQLRALRARINRHHPDLLGFMRRKLFNLPELNERGEEVIDRQKTLDTIERFMETNPPSAEFKAKLVEMLSESRS